MSISLVTRVGVYIVPVHSKIDEKSIRLLLHIPLKCPLYTSLDLLKQFALGKWSQIQSLEGGLPGVVVSMLDCRLSGRFASASHVDTLTFPQWSMLCSTMSV